MERYNHEFRIRSLEVEVYTLWMGIWWTAVAAFKQDGLSAIDAYAYTVAWIFTAIFVWKLARFFVWCGKNNVYSTRTKPLSQVVSEASEDGKGGE